jgi:hypothetical protein
MKVDDQHVAYLRAQIAGDAGIMEYVMGQMTAPGAMDGLVPLVDEAFVLAVRKWFGPYFTHGQVIRLVAQVRGLLSEQPAIIDPAVAESEIRRALGENLPMFPDARVRAPAQMAVFDLLVRELELDEAEIWALLREAREAADLHAVGTGGT